MEPHRVKVCRECGAEMEKRSGRYGEFLGCENYPDCKSTRWREEWRLRPVRRVALDTRCKMM